MKTFQVLTATAFTLMAEEKVDIAVIEVISFLSFQSLLVGLFQYIFMHIFC